MIGGSEGAARGGAASGAASGGGTRLRLARQARGFSQQQLAGMAGVSRQAVSAVESGLSDPSLRVALALARALGLTVEELFGPGSPVSPVSARPVAPLGNGGARVTLAPMGDEFVALPLSGASVSRAGFLPAGGLAFGADGPGASSARGTTPRPGLPAEQAPRTVSVRPIEPPRPTLVVAGCDPAMPLLETPLGVLDPPVAFTWWSCPSEEALRLADAGLVHAAGAHLRGRSGEYNTGPAGELLRQGAEVIGFCSWREGLVLRPELADGVSGVADVARRGLRLVNREPGSEARSVLDRELAGLRIDSGQLPGYGTRATGHLQVAAAITAGLADAGVASEPAAIAYGLAFIPLATERFDLVIPASLAGSREVQALLKVLSSRWLLNQLASLPGYDPSRCGEHVATLPPRAGAPRS
jgi:putative molybdopterin biosynthesis protein